MLTTSQENVIQFFRINLSSVPMPHNPHSFYHINFGNTLFTLRYQNPNLFLAHFHRVSIPLFSYPIYYISCLSFNSKNHFNLALTF